MPLCHSAICSQLLLALNKQHTNINLYYMAQKSIAENFAYLIISSYFFDTFVHISTAISNTQMYNISNQYTYVIVSLYTWVLLYAVVLCGCRLMVARSVPRIQDLRTPLEFDLPPCTAASLHIDRSLKRSNEQQVSSIPGYASMVIDELNLWTIANSYS